MAVKSGCGTVSEEQTSFVFGTKAETLLQLQPQITEAKVPELDFFSLSDWEGSRDAILSKVSARFSRGKLVVRSSALVEDGSQSSMAGAFLSKLNVDASNRSGIAAAIDQVAGSMTGDLRDQVLVQPMIEDVEVSGVIMTFDMVHGAPYYCIDFDDESGRTDAVQLATRQCRLEHVTGIHGALGLAGADHGVDLVDKQDDLPFLLGQIVEHRL